MDDAAVLDFAAQHPVLDDRAGRALAARRWSPVRYAQRLTWLVKQPSSLETHPQVVRRHERLRAQSTRAVLGRA
jgi:hypothetical protein